MVLCTFYAMSNTDLAYAPTTSSRCKPYPALQYNPSATSGTTMSQSQALPWYKSASICYKLPGTDSEFQVQGPNYDESENFVYTISIFGSGFLTPAELLGFVPKLRVDFGSRVQLQDIATLGVSSKIHVVSTTELRVVVPGNQPMGTNRPICYAPPTRRPVLNAMRGTELGYGGTRAEVAAATAGDDRWDPSVAR
eukprot:3075191-Rhodomonas_salina.3